jgi:hypothetical protein
LNDYHNSHELFLQALHILLIGKFGAGKTTVAKRLLKLFYDEWDIRNFGVTSMGQNLINQPWVVGSNFERIEVFKEFMDRRRQFLSATEGEDSVSYYDDCSSVIPSVQAGGTGLSARVKEFEDTFTSSRTNKDHTVTTLWTIKESTKAQQQNTIKLFAAGDALWKHVQRHSADQDRVTKGIEDVRQELGSDFDYLKVPQATQHTIACCFTAGHEEQRKKMLEYNPGVQETVTIIADGDHDGQVAQVSKVSKKGDGSRRYELKGKNGFEMTKVKRDDFFVRGQFSARVIVDIGRPDTFFVIYRDETPLPSDTLWQPAAEKPAAAPDAFSIQVNTSGNADEDCSSSEGETEDDGTVQHCHCLLHVF